MTRLARILNDRNLSFAAVAARAHLQPRTVRRVATGQTPIDRVAVGTMRRIADALSLPASTLLESEFVHPGDASIARVTRLSAAIREVMWRNAPVPYLSPVEGSPTDDMASLTADEFFADTSTIGGGRAG